MEVKVFLLNSFAKIKEGGNPAGVVLNSDNLVEQEMLDIAGKVGFSETAFVQKSEIADFKVRFFTPKAEVDLCGHATIATFSLLKQQGIISDGSYFQETKAGKLKVEVDEKIFMTQNLPDYYQILDKGEIANCLGIGLADFDDLPIQIVSTGLKDIIVPIKDKDRLLTMKPDYEKIARISEKYGVVGIHAFSLENGNGVKAQTRNFAPLYDIPEESATGTANGALACYLFKYNKLDSGEYDLIKIEQGYSLNRPSEIYVKLKVEEGEIREVQVGGVALLAGERKIVI